MGCSDSRETNEINTLRLQCEKLCQENLSILQVLEYLLIEKNNISEAILLLSLKKQTESYYSIISQYRNFWITEAKKSFKDSGDLKHLSSCSKEQEREKTRLSFTRQTLLEQLEKLKPGWQDLHKTLRALTEVLESDSIIMQRSSSLYGSFYHQDRKQLKLASLKHCKNIESHPGSLYLAVKSVTVSLYKIPENRVFYTNKIVHEKSVKDENVESIEKSRTPRKAEDSLINSVIIAGEVKETNTVNFVNSGKDRSKLSINLNRLTADQSKTNPDQARNSFEARFTDQVRLSTDQGRLSMDQFRLSSDHRGSNAETLQKYSKRKERLSESFSSSLEDEETLARLSYTQK